MDFNLPPNLRLSYAGSPPTELDILLTEKIIGRVLPDEFKSLARLSNGGQPSPNRLGLGSRTLYVDFFLALGVGPPAAGPPPETGSRRESAYKLFETLNRPSPHGAPLRPCSPADAETDPALILPDGSTVPQAANCQSFRLAPRETITLVEIWRDLQPQLPPGLIPIAAEAGGGYFCFDHNLTPPSIVFWEPFWLPSPVAASLSDFLGLLTVDYLPN